jgi:putative peptidoglycan lipid II flippase
MVERVFNIVYKEVRGLHQAAYILAIFTFGSQILALIRDRLLANQFGAGIELDLYYTAFRIPDLLYVLFASTLSVYVLIPFIAKHIETESYEKARNVLSQIFSLFLIGYVCMALIAMVSTPYIVQYFFPGFSDHAETLVILIRILLLQPLFLGISSLLGVITQMKHRFVLYAISPLVYNIGIIGGLLFLYPIFGVAGLALGVVVGAILHVCIQLPFIFRSGLAPQLLFTFNVTEIVLICRTSFTRAVTLSLHQIVLFGFIGFASIMAVGSVSVFQFALNLQAVPLAIIGVSYSVAAFPLLAQLFAEKKYVELGQQIGTTLRHIFFWSVPVIAFFVVIRAQFVRVVLGSGAFDWNDTRLTAAVLAILIMSLTAQACNLLLVRALYAVGNTRVPFYVTLLSSWLALVFSLFFYAILASHAQFYAFIATSMRLEGVAGIEVLALPLGYTFALILHACIIALFARKHVYLSLRKLFIPFIQSVAGALVGGYVAYVTLNYFVTVFETDTFHAIFMQGLLAFLSGSVGYVMVQSLFRNRELGEIYCTLKRKFGKGDVIVPQDEDILAV